MSQLTSRGLDNTSSAFVSDLGPCQGPDPLYVTPIQKIVEKSLTFLKKRKFSKTWQDPIYRQNSVYYIHTYIFGCWQAPEPS